MSVAIIQRDRRANRPSEKLTIIELQIDCPAVTLRHVNSFGILHLTDFHYGLPSQDHLLPQLDQIFLEDLGEHWKESGPWDLVLFSGDLVQRGSREEFIRLEGWLETLWNHLRKLNGSGVPDPILLAVPGNHDLQRPAESSPQRVLRALTTDPYPTEGIWDALIGNPDSEYRKVLDQAFAEYRDWWERCPFRGAGRADFKMAPGPLPGDFLATLQKGVYRLGIVGLNTTFLQLTEGNYEGKLAIDVRQFHGTAAGGGAQWVNSVDACVIMTHQPPSWLAEANRTEVFHGLIHPTGRFAAHYCGHLHVPKSETHSAGWSLPRRLIQGGSLYGIETDGQKVQRIHGYSASRIEISSAAEGTIRLWPRIAKSNQASTLKFVRDYTFDLLEKDGGTRGESFPRLRKEDRIAPPPPPRRWPMPYVGPLPTLDPAALFRRHFLGREDLLRDYEDALNGVIARASGLPEGSRSSEVQLMWFHGFGGMGKSWLLRRACIIAEEFTRGGKLPPHVALIDWHLPDWHKPASVPPHDPRELFDAVAYRLAQLYGVQSLDAYWQARAEVEIAWQRHCDLHDRFEDTIISLQQQGPRSNFTSAAQGSPHAAFGDASEKGDDPVRHRRVLERVMRERRYWSDEPSKLAKQLETLRVLQHRFDIPDEEPASQVFECWALQIAGSDHKSVIQPCRFLCDALQNVLRTILKLRPLVLVLDTCEILQSDGLRTVLDSWLRRLVGGLLDGKTALLVLIGSRLRPDIAVPAGERKGWRSEIEAGRFRISPFDEGVRFTVGQIAAALDAETVAPPSTPRLLQHLHRVTLGVPLAVGTLLELHRRGDSVLAELGDLDLESKEALQGSSAWHRVIEVVASRFLLHLEKRPEVAQDFRDICILAMMRNADPAILERFWETSFPGNRLRELAQTYALLADGDLHPTVREFLRRYWRSNPPEQLQSLAGELHQKFRQMPDLPYDAPSLRATWYLNEINFRGWAEGEAVIVKAIQVLPIFLTHNWDFQELVDLVREVPTPSPRFQSLRNTLIEHAENSIYDLSLLCVEWLRRQICSEWQDEERAHLELLTGLALSREGRHGEALRSFETAFEQLGGVVPRRDTFVQAYLSSVVAMPNAQKDRSTASRALVWAERTSAIEPDLWNHEYYWLLHNAGRYDDAEAYLRRVIHRDQSNLSARVFLGHILGVHLNRHEDAKREFLAGIEIDPNNLSLHFFLGDLYLYQLKDFEGAEREYLKARSLANSLFRTDYDRGRVVRQLATLYSMPEFRRPDDAKSLWREAVKLLDERADADVLNSCAWDAYLSCDDLETAEEWARSAVKKAPDDLNALHTLCAVQVRRDRWDAAIPNLTRWLEKVDLVDFKDRWNEYHLTFRDSLTHGRGSEIADLVAKRNEHPQWRTLEVALRRAVDGKREFSELPHALRQVAAHLLTDLLSKSVTRPFPDIPD